MRVIGHYRGDTHQGCVSISPDRVFVFVDYWRLTCLGYRTLTRGQRVEFDVRQRK